MNIKSYHTPIPIRKLKNQTAILLAILSASILTNCTDSNSVYTLYRTGMDTKTLEHDETLRIHVATFDSQNGATNSDIEKYNLAVCSLSKDYFEEKQPSSIPDNSGKKLIFKYWCEKGYYKK